MLKNRENILIHIKQEATQFILSGNCPMRFGDAVDTVVCASDDGWWHHLNRIGQFPGKINCVTLHFVGYILEYYYDAPTHKR
jgi:hypothetical protein